jgi:hypothetical protein
MMLPVYFAFASGRLRYDCETCAQRCCAGNGFSVRDGQELKTLVSMSPEFMWFTERGRAITHVFNCPPQCFFLAADGMCSIEEVHGHSAKPQACRHFPFNDCLQIGDTLVIAPTQGLCPLTVIPPPETSPCSAHEALLMEWSGAAPDATVPRHSGSAVDLELERRVLAASEAAAASRDYLAFAEQQRRFWWEVNCLARPTESLDQFASLVWRAAGLVSANEMLRDPEVALLMAGLTPSLRVSLLCPPPHLTPYRIRPSKIAHAMLILAILIGLAKRAGMRIVNVQTVFRVLQVCRPIIALLARLDEVLDEPSLVTATTKLYAADDECAAWLRAVATGSRRGRPLAFVLDDVLATEPLRRIGQLKSLARVTHA